MNRGLFCGASVLTVAFFATALASTAQAAAAAAPAAPAAAPAASEVGEVVVTAEKRSTKLERTPVAVTALTAQMRDLQGISSVQDMTDVTPGFAYNSLTNRPFMRGVGRNTDNLATDSGVASYLDGVFNGANATTILQSDSLFVDRIDVMRGPQGTLYGRNSDGGAINYVSKRPTNEFEAEGRVGIASYDKYYGEAAVSGPITDSLKFRLGGNYTSETGGYFKNLGGSAEGGSVAQGGNGTSYHAEVQLQGNIGDTFDYWAKAATSDFNVSFHTETQTAPFDDSSNGGLAPSAFYGLCALPGGASGLNCGLPGGPGGVVGNYVPGSATPTNAVGTNPAANSLRDFAAAFRSSSNMHDDVILAGTMTYHFPGVDLKYTGGYQSYVYALYFPLQGSNVGPVTTNLQSYQLQGPATATALCSSVYSTGCTGNFTVNAGQNAYGFTETDAFYSHELNLTSTTNGPVQYILGFYYYHEHFDQPIGLFDPGQTQVLHPINWTGAAAPANPLGCVYCTDQTITTESVAGFGQVDWAINDQWKLTGGLRYTDDHKWGMEQVRYIGVNFLPGVLDSFGLKYGVNTWGANTPAVDYTSLAALFPFPTTANPGAAKPTYNSTTGYEQRLLNASWSAVTGTANLAWTPDHDTMAYFRYSRGYKSGGFDSGAVITDPETQSEFVDAYELGVKKVFGRTLQINAAAFYYNYSNDQVPLGYVTPGGNIITVLYNIPTVRSYGVELETVWKPIEPLVLSLNYAYLNSTITKTGGACFENTADPRALGPDAKISGCGGPNSSGVQTQNITGNQMPEATPNKVSLNAVYTFRLEPGNLALSGSYIWKDKTYYSVFNASYDQAPSYAQVNVRATWTDAKDRYTVFVYADNLFNTLGYDTAVGAPISASPLVVYKGYGLTAPTTYGVEFQYRFR
jgi:iron complex outermembrane receptor protein